MCANGPGGRPDVDMSAPVRITRQTLADEAAANWTRMFRGSRWNGSRQRAIGEALTTLGPHPAPDEVDAIVGNRSWTALPNCDGCGRDSLPLLIRLGGEPGDSESPIASLCTACLRAALVLAEDSILCGHATCRGMPHCAYSRPAKRLAAAIDQDIVNGTFDSGRRR